VSCETSYQTVNLIDQNLIFSRIQEMATMIETLREQLRASQELTNTSSTFEGGPAPKLADLQAQVNIVGLVFKH
jgi:hypothetical protein